MSANRRTHWGFHQLTDDWARRLVARAGVLPGDLVLDIGAGNGAVTAPLASAGARVIAFELHPRRAQQLRSRFAGCPVKVVQVDAVDLRLPRRPFRVVANPPFGITTGLLRRLLSPGSRLASAHLVVPRHVADRWSAPRAPGINRWRPSFAVTVDRTLPRRAFRPPPPMETAVIRVVRSE